MLLFPGDVHFRAAFGMQFWYILITCPSQFTHWHLIFYYAQAKKENRLDIAVEQPDLCSHVVLLWLGWSLANVTLLQPFSFFLVFAHSAAKLGKDLDKAEWITVYCNGCIWIGIYAYHIGFGGADVKTHLLNKGVQPCRWVFQPFGSKYYKRWQPRRLMKWYISFIYYSKPWFPSTITLHSLGWRYSLGPFCKEISHTFWRSMHLMNNMVLLSMQGLKLKHFLISLYFNNFHSASC